MNTPQLLDVTNTITAFTDITPTLFTDEAQEVVTSVLYNIEMDEEGHTVLGIVLDPIHDSLILTETEGHSFALNSRYTLAGIATLNDLSFSIEELDTCVACDLSSGVIGGSSESTQSTETEETQTTKSINKPIIH